METKRSLLVVALNVRFRYIPYEMVVMFDALLAAAKVQGVQPVITGAAYEDYPEGKVHSEGYGLDVRASNLPDPQGFAEGLQYALDSLSPHYKVLYGEGEHKNHIHIGFAWHYARRL